MRFAENIQGYQWLDVFPRASCRHDAEENAKCLKWRHLHTRFDMHHSNKLVQEYTSEGKTLLSPVAGINSATSESLNDLIPLLHGTARISSRRRILLMCLGIMGQMWKTEVPINFCARNIFLTRQMKQNQCDKVAFLLRYQ